MRGSKIKKKKRMLTNKEIVVKEKSKKNINVISESEIKMRK